MADHAFILKISSTVPIVVTDNDVDITFGGDTYLANESLNVVEDLSLIHI